jgi:hypothetical protein
MKDHMRPTAQTTSIASVNFTLGWIESGHRAKSTKAAIPEPASGCHEQQHFIEERRQHAADRPGGGGRP